MSLKNSALNVNLLMLLIFSKAICCITKNVCSLVLITRIIEITESQVLLILLCLRGSLVLSAIDVICF